MKWEERRDNGAPRTHKYWHLNSSPTRRQTPFQEVLEVSAQMWQRAAELLDERGFDVFLDMQRIRVAREIANQLTRRHRRAA